MSIIIQYSIWRVNIKDMFCCNEVFVSFDIYNHFLKCASFKNTYKFRNTASTFEYISIYNMKYSIIVNIVNFMLKSYWNMVDMKGVDLTFQINSSLNFNNLKF